jgi:APA family basic amino acid/polyamine antiporter
VPLDGPRLISWIHVDDFHWRRRLGHLGRAATGICSMAVNFLLMCLTVLTLPRRNPLLAHEVKVLTSRPKQVLLAGAGVVMLTLFLVIHIVKDLAADTAALYFHSTPVWIIVMGMGSAIYVREQRKLKKEGVDTKALFSHLPPE